MFPGSLPFALPLFATAAFTGGLAFYAFRRAARPGALTVGLLMAALSEWAAFYALELLAPDLPSKLLAIKLQYLGIAAVPPLWLAFALRYTGHVSWLSRSRRLLLATPSALTFILTLTNEWHALIWTGVSLDPDGAPAIHITGRGAWFWVHTFISYTFILIGIALHAITFARAARPYRRQATMMLIGAITPLAGNALFLAGLSPVRWLDPTPFIFALSGALLALSFFRFGLLEIMPIAAPLVIEHMPDAVIVVDILNRVIDLNPAARHLFGVGEEALGHNLFEALWPTQAMAKSSAFGVSEGQMELEISKGGERRVFQLTVSPILDGAKARETKAVSSSTLLGRLLVLRDVTREHTLLEAERRRARQMELLNEITQASLREADFYEMLQVLADRLGELFKADGAFITLWDETQECTIPAAAYGELREQYLTFRPEPGETTLTESVLRAGHALAVEDAFNTPYLSPRIAALFPTRSILALPLIVGGGEPRAPLSDGPKALPLVNMPSTHLGAALIAFNQTHYFTPEEIALGEQAAGQIALAMAKARALETEREQRQLAEALRQVGLALSESLDIETVLDRLLDEIGRVVPYDSALIMLVEHSSQSSLGRARVTRMRGYEQFGAQVVHDIAALSFEIETTENLRRMAETGEPLIIPNTAAYPGWIKKVETSAYARSWAGVPIMAHGHVIAFFSLDKVEPDFYRPKHAERLAAFAGQAALAVENARLFAETQRRAEEQRILYEATREFTAGLEEEAVLIATARRLADALQTSGCTLSRWDRAQDCLVTLLSYDRTRGEIEARGTQYPLANYPTTRRVLETHRPMIIHADDPTADLSERAVLEKYGYASVLMLPLGVGEHTFGLVEISRRADDPPFTDASLQLARSLSGPASVALENARLHAEVKALSVTDGLTGLANRRAFDRALEREVARAQRYGNPLALIILDIDSFKQYNDAYGHLAGDARLKAIAELLRNNVRDLDLAARYGGEEFALILPHTKREGAVALAERIRAAAEQMAYDEERVTRDLTCATGHPSPIPGYTLSLGVAAFPEDGQTPQSLLLAADEAELAAKRAGKNRVCLAGA
ncbi:MAG: diguanylate cyclase [Anaerolineales bacterium]|nr:diguanylate cyclase [Anaerolineales bacterium]